MNFPTNEELEQFNHFDKRQRTIDSSALARDALFKTPRGSLNTLEMAYPLTAFDRRIELRPTMCVTTCNGKLADPTSDLADSYENRTHVYLVDGRAVRGSISDMLNYIFGEFHEQEMATHIATSPRILNDRTYKYFQCGREKMEDLWDSHLGKYAASDFIPAESLFDEAPKLIATAFTRTDDEYDSWDDDTQKVELLSAFGLFRQHYTTVAREALLDEWRDIRERGSDDHLSCEMFYNGIYVPELERFRRPQFNQFILWHSEWVRAKDLVPFGTERRLCDFSTAQLSTNDDEPSRAICGSVDLLLADRLQLANWKPGQHLDVIMIDYKFNEEIGTHTYNRSVNPILKGVPCNKIQKQFTQLAAYMYMLHRHTELRVKSAHIVQFCEESYYMHTAPKSRVNMMAKCFQQYSESLLMQV